MTAYGSIIVIFMLAVRHSEGGCHVNNWPHSCQANFRIGRQRCEPCESGSHGCNCSVPCPSGTYGQGCYHVCGCSDKQFCDPVLGCTNTTRTTIDTTAKSTPHLEVNKRDGISPPSVKSYTDQQTILTVVGITIGALPSIGVLSNVVCFCFLYRRKSGSISLGKVNRDLKSTGGIIELGTSDKNIDVHSYLTISDRSMGLYTGVHYDEAEEGKSSLPLSLQDPSIGSDSCSSSLSLHGIKEEVASIKSDTSKLSQGYLTPVVTTVEKTIRKINDLVNMKNFKKSINVQKILRNLSEVEIRFTDPNCRI